MESRDFRWFADGLFPTPLSPKKERRAATDRNVGNVEGRPMVKPDVEIKKIHDASQDDSVYGVADGARKHQSGRTLNRRTRDEFHACQGYDGNNSSEPRKKHALPAARIRQKREGRPGVSHVAEIKKRRDGEEFTLVKMCLNPNLDDLIQNEEGKPHARPNREGAPGSTLSRFAVGNLRHLRKEPLFAGAEEVFAAARAKPHVFRIVFGAVRVVPAADALLAGRGFHRHRQGSIRGRPFH